MSEDLLVELGYKFEEDGIEYLVCVVINNLAMVSLPVEMITHVQQEAGIEEIVWPLGAYLILQPSGLTLAIFGRINGELAHRGGNFKLESEATLGPDMWALWQELRGTSESVLQDNLKKMVHHTMLQHEGGPDIDAESLGFFQDQLTRLTAEWLGVARKRIRANLYFVEQGYVSVELVLDGQLLDPTDERHKLVTKRFERYLASAKPN